MNSPLPAGLLEEISLGSAKGGKRPEIPVEIEVVRTLTPDDLPAIQAPPPVLGPVQLVHQLRASHHRLAELLAKGQLDQTEISLVTGYSQGYISNIKRDPAFAELMAYYATQKETIFTDAMTKLAVLGTDAVEILHEKLLDPNVEWAKRELMELVEMAVVKPAAAKQATSGGQAPAVSLEVKFVGARPRDGGQIIEVAATGDLNARSQP